MSAFVKKMILDFISSLDGFTLIESVPIYVCFREGSDKLIIEFKDFMYFDVFLYKEIIDINHRFCRDFNISMFDNYVNILTFLEKNIGIIDEKIKNIFMNNKE